MPPDVAAVEASPLSEHMCIKGGVSSAVLPHSLPLPASQTQQTLSSLATPCVCTLSSLAALYYFYHHYPPPPPLVSSPRAHHHLLPSPTNLTPNYPDHHHARHGLLNTPLHARHRALIITRRVPPGLARRRRRRAVPRARDRAPVLPLRLARRARAQLPLQVAAPPLDVVS